MIRSSVVLLASAHVSTAFIIAAPAPLIRARVGTACMKDLEASPPTALEECILSAHSEDDVQACMQYADAQLGEVDEHTHAALDAMDDLIDALLDAKSEDDVGRYMALWDERREAEASHLEASYSTTSPPMRDADLIRAKATAASAIDSAREEPTALEECIINAESEDGVQECMQMHEDARAAEESHLEASYSTTSPPMRDADLIRAKAAAASVIDSAGEAPTALEECIIDAKSEDGVQACMQMYEDAD